jgi:hypothetical protein
MDRNGPNCWILKQFLKKLQLPVTAEFPPTPSQRRTADFTYI